MNYHDRVNALRLVERIRAMHKSEVSCTCGRHYRITFGTEEIMSLVDMLEASVKGIVVEPAIDADRFSLIDIK